MLGYVRLSYRIFGTYVKPLKKYFMDTKNDIQKAGMRYTLEEYLSTAFFTVTITFIIETVILSFIFGLFFSTAIAVSLALMLSIAVSCALFFLFYSYPTAMSASRAKKINSALPFAVSYLASISSGKIHPAIMFKTLAQFKEYGEVSRESENISRNIDLFGMTVSSALRKEAEKTPSTEFRDVLYGMNTTITSGSDLTAYLREKGNELMDNYKRMIMKYSQDLSLFVEVYITLVITGSIFFIVLSSIMSVISGGLGTAMIQTFVVFILLPLISFGFIMLLKTISPLEK